MFKTSLLVVGNENHFRAVFIFFLSVFDCFDQLSVFVLFGGFVISKQVFNDFKRFGTVLVKNSFFCQKILFCCLVMKTLSGCFHCALTVFDVFDQFLVFVLLGRICRF